MTSTRLLPGNSRGFTLVEIMITVAILAVIAAVAIPYYSDYVSSSKQGAMNNNIESIRVFEKNYQLQHKVYISGTYDPSDPGSASGLKTRIGWAPRTQKDAVTYVVTCEVPNADTTNPEHDHGGRKGEGARLRLGETCCDNQ